MSNRSVKKGLVLMRKAEAEEMGEKYKEALQHYEEAVKYFIHAFEYEVQSERAKERIRSNIVQCFQKMEKIKAYIRKSKAIGRRSMAI